MNEKGKHETKFVRPLGHYQIEGDYHSSWHPWIEDDDKKIVKKLEKESYDYAERIMDKLGGFGLFAHEMFVDTKAGKVYANETACRPHDTGLVTMASMPLGYSEFALHAKAVLGMPIVWDDDVIEPRSKAASHVILSHTECWYPQYQVDGRLLAEHERAHLRQAGELRGTAHGRGAVLRPTPWKKRAARRRRAPTR